MFSALWLIVITTITFLIIIRFALVVIMIRALTGQLGMRIIDEDNCKLRGAYNIADKHMLIVCNALFLWRKRYVLRILRYKPLPVCYGRSGSWSTRLF